MRILFVNSVCGIGSTGRIVTDLANAAANLGHICSIAYGLGEAKYVEGMETVKICNSTGYYLSNFASKLSGFTGGFNSTETQKLIRHIEKFKPDLIHLHNLHGYYVSVFKLFEYLNKVRIPIIWTLHDCWGYTGNCACYSHIGCQKWQTQCYQCPQIQAYPKSYFFDFTAQMFERKELLFSKAPIKAITTPSHWLCREVEQSILGRFPCVPIHNGMDAAQFKIQDSDFKKREDLQGKRIVLGVANAWGEKKGLFDFYKLADMLPENYKVVLVGLSADQMRQLPKNIRGIQRTESIGQLVDIYNAAEVFVNPSYEETFGMVTAEALLCGVPVITYDKTAVPEVADAPYGRVVPAGNVEKLLEEVLCTRQYDRKAIRDSALKYSKSEMARKYLELYELAAKNEE